MVLEELGTVVRDVDGEICNSPFITLALKAPGWTLEMLLVIPFKYIYCT